jgi:hypothetical protein
MTACSITFPNQENQKMDTFEERIEYYTTTAKHFNEINVNLAQQSSIDYCDFENWKCVDLRIHLRKILDDEPQSRVGLSKWKKEKLIKIATEIRDNFIMSNKNFEAEALWKILDIKMEFKGKEQGVSKKEIYRQTHNFFAKIRFEYNDIRTKLDIFSCWILFNPQYKKEIEEKVANFQFEI